MGEPATGQTDDRGAARAAEVADRLHSAAVHLLRAVRRVDVETGLSAARLSALSVLVFGGPRTVGELAEAEGVRSPTMSRLVSGLEADGLVARRPVPGDRRAAAVVATAAGEAVLAAGRHRRVGLLGERLGRLDPDELAMLERAAALMEVLAR